MSRFPAHLVVFIALVAGFSPLPGRPPLTLLFISYDLQIHESR